MTPSQTGIEFLRSLPAERSAPLAEHLGFSLTVVEPGRVVFEIVPATHHENPMGTVHGGVLATLCDSAMGAAVHSTLPAGSGYTTLELKVSFLRPVTAATGPLRCEGTVFSRGARVATAQATIRDGKDRPVAHATCTCLIFSVEEVKANGGSPRKDPA